MIHVRSVAEAKPLLRDLWGSGETVGSIHTLGALHLGHAHLVEQSARENRHTVVTVYPNRIQLFPGSRYVYDLEEDVELARAHGATLVISTTDAEMYPSEYRTFIDQGAAHRRLNSSVFEYATRGQVTGAIRWICLTRPTRSYFGMKDIEQALMVERAVVDLLIPCEIRHYPCIRFRETRAPISSRLQGLPLERLREVGRVYEALEAGRQLILDGETDPRAVLAEMRRSLEPYLKTFKVVYLTAVDVSEFAPMERLILPLILHCAITDGRITHFDGLCIRTKEELRHSPEVVWIDDPAP
jgi:pantoate--beta-alanine ligase